MHSLQGADTATCCLLRLSDLAAAQAKVIEQRAHEKGSLEADKALRRRSCAICMGRPSFDAAGVGRGSSTLEGNGSVRCIINQ